MSDIVVMRDIDIITTEIKSIEAQVARAAIYGFIEIGKRLVEAKEIVGHGNWGKFLEEKVSYSQQWATNLMHLYREYGGAQESLFENFANSQSFGKIDVTKHILLLGVPAEERAEFAREHDAENASTRELQAAIRERDAALAEVNQQTARAEQARNKAADLENQLDIAGDKLAAQDGKIKDLQAQVAAEKQKSTDAAEKVDKITKQLKKAKDAEKAANAALQTAKEHPEIPESLMEEMRQQVAADAAKEATAELQKQLEEAQAAQAQAEQRQKDTEAALAEAEKKAKAADGNIALVKAYLEGVQEQFNKLLGAIKLVEQVDPERGATLRRNAREKVLPKLMEALAST